mmetsp:Transcript_73971/g.176050  ORF Transcript_73971/g.176050 Transcript_73971/m.176050 type:complete len:293 (-) Transcript_73971:105-983(-)
MEAQQQWLLDLPLDVLQFQAQELGIDSAACPEKEQLVQRILQAQSTDAGDRRSTSEPLSEDQLRLMQEDEAMARRLQEEEQERLDRRRNRSRGGRGSNHGTGQREAIDGLLQQLQELRGRLPNRQADHRPMEYLNTGAEAREREAREAADDGDGAPAVPSTRGGIMLTPQTLAGLLSSLGQEADGSDGARAHQTLPLLAHLLNQLATMQTGLDRDVIDSLTATASYEASVDADGEFSKCMVCLESFQAKDELRILPCLHRYHKGCVDEWLSRSAECPVCKFDITRTSFSGET